MVQVYSSILQSVLLEALLLFVAIRFTELEHQIMPRSLGQKLIEFDLYLASISFLK